MAKEDPQPHLLPKHVKNLKHYNNLHHMYHN